MDEITVDRETLKALGADTRIAILKKLGTRRMTQAELASELGMRPPTISEHLSTLEAAELVTHSSDSGHKWKYYELTQKGSAVVRPSSARLWLALAVVFLAFSAAFVFFNAQSGAIAHLSSFNFLSSQSTLSGDSTSNVIISPQPFGVLGPAYADSRAFTESDSRAVADDSGSPPTPPAISSGASGAEFGESDIPPAPPIESSDAKVEPTPVNATSASSKKPSPSAVNMTMYVPASIIV